MKIGSLVEQGDEGLRGTSPKEQQFLSTGVFSLRVVVHSTNHVYLEKSAIPSSVHSAHTGSLAWSREGMSKG